MTLNKILLLAAAYFVTGWLGLEIPYAGPDITLVWLPSGIAIAALFRWGRAAWPGIYLASLAVNLSIGSAWPVAVGIAVGHTLAPLLAVRWLKYAGFQRVFNSQRDVGLFVVAACLGMTVSASAGVAALYLAGRLPGEAMGVAWLLWWMGDTVGVLLAAPVLLSLDAKNLGILRRERGVLLFWNLLAITVAWFAFIQGYEQIGRALPWIVLTLPLSVWAALRFGIAGAALAGLGFSLMAAASAIAGHGVFSTIETRVSLVLLWTYMASNVLTGLLVTAMQAERQQVVNTLRESEEKLRGLYELSPLGIALTDMNGRFIEFNEAFRSMCGYSADELKAIDSWTLTPKAYEVDEARQLELLNCTGCYGPYEKEYCRKDGTRVPLQFNGLLMTRDDGQKFIWSIVEDITERKRTEDRIEELAFFDHLTHLPNRTLLQDRLKQAMTTGSRNDTCGAVLFIDLDHFKTLNDTLGHDKGDLLLQQVAQRIVACVREGDTVARLGGDEFVIVLENLSSNVQEAATQTELIGKKVLAALGLSYHFDELDHRTTASIGATLFRGYENSSDDLLKQADLAMYKAKDSGRNALQFFDPAMQVAIIARAALESGLRCAIQEKQFVLHYQAQVVDGGRVTGAEVLVRWQHPERGLVPPLQFIPLAEETGLILPLGQWVLETACRQLAAWSDRAELAHLTIAVNVSAHQFRAPDFVAQVLTALMNTGAKPDRLKLELTESLLVSDIEAVIEKMFALKAKGVGFSLDDFGTGYSSLAYLKRLPLDQLKIDQSFVRDVLSDPNDAAIARTIVALAQSLGLGVIAEGVETEAQRDFLAHSGCHAYQGYLFSRPLPVEHFEEFVVTQ